MLPGRGDNLAPRFRRRPADGHVPERAVRDLEHTRDLCERLRVGVEVEYVVARFALAVDLVRELAPSPRLVADPAAAALLDQLARAREDLVLALLGQLGVEHEHDLVRVHVPEPPSLGLAASPARAARERTAPGEAGSRTSIASASPCPRSLRHGRVTLVNQKEALALGAL